MARTALEAATVHLSFAHHVNPYMGRTPGSLFDMLDRCTDVAKRLSIRAALNAHYGTRVRFSSEAAPSERGAL